MPVKQTTESVTKDGKHYHWGSPNFEKQYDIIQPQSALISPHRKQIQEFLADTPEDDTDIIEIKESPDVQDYIDFTEIEQNEHQYVEPQPEQLKKRKRVDKGTEKKSTPSNMSKKDMRLLKNKTKT